MLSVRGAGGGPAGVNVNATLAKSHCPLEQLREITLSPDGAVTVHGSVTEPIVPARIAEFGSVIEQPEFREIVNDAPNVSERSQTPTTS
jgi:hypothetical protein